MEAKLSMAGPGLLSNRPLNSLSAAINVKSLVRFADNEARRWALIRRMAEKLRSADAEATGIVSTVRNNANKSG